MSALHALLLRILVTTYVALVGLLTPYDTSHISACSTTACRLVAPLSNWDGVYFHNVFSTFTYQFEQFSAFLPGLPALARLAVPFSVTDTETAFVISALAVNIGMFVPSLWLLQHITAQVFGNKHLTAATSILFTISPAVPFFAVAYSESSYFFFTLAGIYCCFRASRFGDIWLWLGAFSFTASACIRSNGIVNAGFIIFRALQLGFSPSASRGWCSRMAAAVVVMAAVVMIALPSTAYQLYISTLFCAGKDSLVGEVRLLSPPYCQQALPQVYPHVQSEYWHVGPFRYWEMKQLPNFVLASPIITVTLLGGLALVKSVWTQAGHSSILGFAKSVLSGATMPRTSPVLCLVPFVVHTAVLLATGIVVMHIQVITRFLCSSTPLVYWAAAALALRSSGWRWAIVGYCVTYIVVGTTLFANFLPWT